MPYLDDEEYEHLHEMARRSGRVNALEEQLADMTAERDRLRELLLTCAREMAELRPEYPTAEQAMMSIGAPMLPEERRERMAQWDNTRANYLSGWDSYVNTFRTQATV